MDPLLRANVWKFLRETLKEQQVSILLTTHYIHEANYADHVGFLRNGTLMVDGPPQKILAHFEHKFDSLDEIFLNICEQKLKGSGCVLKIEGSPADITINKEVDFPERSRRFLDYKILQTMISEELIQYKREPL
jgi:ABC-type multidrug transport system ATPase subunit